MFTSRLLNLGCSFGVSWCLLSVMMGVVVGLLTWSVVMVMVKEEKGTITKICPENTDLYLQVTPLL